MPREKRQHTRARLAYMDGYSRGVEHLDYLEANNEYTSIIWLHTINVVEVGAGGGFAWVAPAITNPKKIPNWRFHQTPSKGGRQTKNW